MPLFINSKRAGALFFNGKSVAQAWRNGSKVFQKGASAGPALLTPTMTGANTPAPFVVDSSGVTADYPAWQAFDRNLGKIAHSAYNPGQVWISIDLGQSRQITAINMISRTSGYQQDTPSVVAIQYSSDNINWDTYKTVSGIPVPPADNTVFLNESVDFSTRYFRVLMGNTRGRGYIVIAEIEIYGY
jgi:hypothetical protein